VSQVLAEALATLRESPAGTGPSAGATASSPAAFAATTADADADTPTAKVYFVEFPPAAAAVPAAPPEAPMEPRIPAAPAPEPASEDTEIVLPETAEASLFRSDEERTDWTPPMDIPTWWTRGGAQG